MREAGVEPFEYSFTTTHAAQDLLQQYRDKLEPGEEDETADVSVAGRIMTRRVFGKLAFYTLQDETGVIQLQFDKNRLGDTFKVLYIEIHALPAALFCLRTGRPT
jgi:lysyl-tRNA synthetase class 2